MGLIECPFLALSATLGNVSHLHTWLEGLETARGRTGEKGLEFILHNKRWNDLDYSVFRADIESGERDLVAVNPITLFSLSQLSSDRWMSLVKLVPEQLQMTLEHLRSLSRAPAECAALLSYCDQHLGVVGLPDMFGSQGLSPLEKLETDVKLCIHRLAQNDPAACQVCNGPFSRGAALH